MSLLPRRKSATRANMVNVARKAYMTAHKSAYAKYWAVHADAKKEYGEGHPEFHAKMKVAQAELVRGLMNARAARNAPTSGIRQTR
jgi:hypothetical protein